MSALPLADGPAMYFGSTILTFALPFGAFIVAAVGLFLLFRVTHSGPRLRWSADSAAQVSSVTTREPGPAPAPEVIAASDVASIAPDPIEEDILAQHALAAQAAADDAADDAAGDAAGDAAPAGGTAGGTAVEETEGKDGGQE